MILTAHQPTYLPWLGLFHKIANADVFCYFDIAQYQKKDFNNRNKIKTYNGPIWLSVPVESKNHFQTSVGKIKIINNGWNKKHFKSIKLAYKKAKFFNDYIKDLEYLFLKKNYETLSELNLVFLKYFLKKIKIKTPIILASDYNFKGRKSDLILDMCIKLNAKEYIFGEQGRNYADEKKFFDHGIKVHFQKYAHPIYDQIYGEFLPNMSIVDLLFNEGSKSKEIILKNNNKYKN